MITHKSIGYNGRLGNQMFQYAVLRALSLEKGYEMIFPNTLTTKPDSAFDLTNNQWIEVGFYLIDCFELDSLKIDKENILSNTIINSYNESTFEFNSSVFDISDFTSLEGYFQSPKYFEKYKDIILKDFTFRSYILDKANSFISQYPNPISIHIRRGDYVNHPGYWTITPEYIQEALNHFTDNKYTFLIFSDDIEWCKQIFPEGVIFIEGNNQFEDLCLMSLCDHNIISNSSYSWWGAYLNQNKNKKIIEPKNWFTPAKPLNDLYPKAWIII